MKAGTEVVIIVALTQNRVIGRDNAMPWRLKADLARFKALTLAHPILMGRKTWESLGRPLPGRRNLVVTRDPDYRAPGAETFPGIESALAAAGAGERIFIIGGADIYRQSLALADRLLLTEIHAEIDGDAHFPALDPAQFIEVSRLPHKADADNDHDFDFVEYRRKT